MSDSIISTVKADLLKAKRESVKATVKKLYTDYIAAQEVVNGIEQKIVEELESLGESPEVIKQLLAE